MPVAVCYKTDVAANLRLVTEALGMGSAYLEQAVGDAERRLESQALELARAAENLVLEVAVLNLQLAALHSLPDW